MHVLILVGLMTVFGLASAASQQTGASRIDCCDGLERVASRLGKYRCESERRQSEATVCGRYLWHH